MQKVSKKFHELWSYREMFQGLVSREIRARYKGSFLGFFWSLLNPLLMMAIYSIVFAHVMRVQIPHYSLHLLAGLLPWTWFTTSISNSTGSVVANSNLIKKIYFPNEILPLVSVTTNLVNYLFSVPILLGFMAFQQVPFTSALLMLPLLLAVQFILSLGFGLILATLNVYFRDVEQLLGVVLMAWFYLTPIIYPLSFVPERFQGLAMLNPMAGLVVSYQRIFMEGALPHVLHLLYPLCFGLALLAAGYAIFVWRKYDFAELV